LFNYSSRQGLSAHELIDHTASTMDNRHSKKYKMHVRTKQNICFSSVVRAQLYDYMHNLTWLQIGLSQADSQFAGYLKIMLFSGQWNKKVYP
jgi:hypothetical protein